MGSSGVQERRELDKVAPLLTWKRIPLWVPLADRIQKVVGRKPAITLQGLKALQTDPSLATLCISLHHLPLKFTNSPHRVEADVP